METASGVRLDRERERDFDGFIVILTSESLVFTSVSATLSV